MPGDEGENEYTYAGSVHLREFPSQKGFLASLATPRMGKSNTVAIEIPFEVSKAKREEQQRDIVQVRVGGLASSFQRSTKHAVGTGTSCLRQAGLVGVALGQKLILVWSELRFKY